VLSEWFVCRRCGYRVRSDEIMLMAFMELAGAVVSKKLKYCWVDDDECGEEHDFIVEGDE